MLNCRKHGFRGDTFQLCPFCEVEKENEMKSGLDKYSTEDLEIELSRRQDRSAEKPIPLDSANWGVVYNMCIDFIDSIADKGYAPKNFEQHLYGEALIAIYGKDVWDWINEHYDE